ncbi:extracellular solute-binding protein [Nostoc sp.]|uniref:extracellular solute-binding protein n=1 Tax=Nostoc sp. TaxID=1180 RepID=UPI002FF5B6AA
MDRRSFLLGTGTLALSQLLFGCGGNNQRQLKVELLKGSIPGQVVNQFQKSLQQQVELKFAPVEQIEDLFEQLQQNWRQKQLEAANQQKPSPFFQRIQTLFESIQGLFEWIKNGRRKPKATDADLVTLGDYWLKAAIEQNLIESFEKEEVNQLKQWSALDEKWKKLVTRNDKGDLDIQGKVWGAPYRWGSTMIVYNRDKFQELGWTPRDWSDLWRHGLQQRISLLNQPREVVGLVLKKLGKSYNTENLDQVSDLEKELQILNKQVKFYSSNNYLEPLIMGDTWLAVGWSSDILPVLGRYPQLAAVIPQSGTAIWADLWVRPKGITWVGSEGIIRGTLSKQWIDFCWQPSIAKQISVLTKSNSPISTNITASDIQEPLWNLLHSDVYDGLRLGKVLDKSEFLLPLLPSVIKQYESLFAKIKV